MKASRKVCNRCEHREYMNSRVGWDRKYAMRWVCGIVWELTIAKASSIAFVYGKNFMVPERCPYRVEHAVCLRELGYVRMTCRNKSKQKGRET